LIQNNARNSSPASAFGFVTIFDFFTSIICLNPNKILQKHGSLEQHGETRQRAGAKSRWMEHEIQIYDNIYLTLWRPINDTLDHHVIDTARHRDEGVHHDSITNIDISTTTCAN